jgi:hypothetical protein
LNTLANYVAATTADGEATTTNHITTQPNFALLLPHAYRWIAISFEA